MIGIKDLAQLNIARRRKRPAPPPRPGSLAAGLQRAATDARTDSGKLKAPPAFPPPPRKPATASAPPPARMANPLRASAGDGAETAQSTLTHASTTSSIGRLKQAPPGYWKPPPPSAAPLPESAKSVQRDGARSILTPLSAAKQIEASQKVKEHAAAVESPQEDPAPPAAKDSAPGSGVAGGAPGPAADIPHQVASAPEPLAMKDDCESEADAQAAGNVAIERSASSGSGPLRKSKPQLTISLLDAVEEDEDSDGDVTSHLGNGPKKRASARAQSQGLRLGGASTKLSLQIDSDDEDEEGNGLGILHGQGTSSAEVIAIGNFEVREDGIRSETASEGNVKDELIMMSALGQGAGGIVYKAVHRPTLRLVAVKTIPVYDPKKRSQMLKELKALYENMAPIGYKDKAATLLDSSAPAPCPFIVTFHDAFINPEMANVAMVVEYMDGGSLQDIIDAGGCANEDVLSQIAYRVLRGLQFIHDRHQIHRDIKPSNLLINHRGEVKISDFGIVRELESTQAMASTFVGTLTYMSPERISGLAYNANSDVWSFGLSLMSVALGAYPLATAGGYWALLSSLNEGPVPRLPEDRFSPIVIDFVEQCLTRDPQQRPSCEQLLLHPFVTQSQALVDTQMAAGENVPPTDAEANLAELDDLVQGLARPEEQRLAPRPPLDNVARQLGVSLSLVEAKFAALISKSDE